MSRFPDNKRFAFTIFDDTDFSTVENVRPIYRMLGELGIRTTKSVWPLSAPAGTGDWGSSMDDQAYRDFVFSLKRDGFEIALHNVRSHSTTRDVVQQGLARFRELFGEYPRIHCNHQLNRDNLYWGTSRINSRAIRMGYNLTTRFKRSDYFTGHVEASPYYWGDLCQKHIRYVRNLTFDEINLDRVNPTMPYRDLRKPLINYWFSSTDGGSLDRFCRNVSEHNQDRLEAEGGVCIISTHFGARNFCNDGAVHAEFTRLMRRLANKNGWFVPVTIILDHLRSTRENSIIPHAELVKMERRWFAGKLKEHFHRHISKTNG